MIMWLSILIVSVYFIIGGAATVIINKKKPVEARQRWTKYLVYFFIVVTILGCIRAGVFNFAAIVIVVFGLFEIVRIGRGKNTIMIVALLLYSAIAYGFVFFSYWATEVDQMSLYVIVLSFDGFSQISGQLFGKTKLAPSISPGKTIEGLTGGALIAIATSTLLWYNEPLQNRIPFGFFVCVMALAGDLLASYYKRKCGVKDYSSLIPGHGGFLDRFDSLIFAGAGWSVLKILFP